MTPDHSRQLELDGKDISLEDVGRVAERKLSTKVSTDGAFLERLAESRRVLEEALARGEVVYGVATGFGDSCETSTRDALDHDLARNLFRYHHAGVGELLPRAETRAVLFARAVSLARGYSAVRTELLERLCALLNEDMLPAIPSLGSVGASGDLTPLAYVAAALSGEGELYSQRGPLPAETFWARLGPGRLLLTPRESLAVMNGTSVMTALAALAVLRAERLVRIASALTAFAWEALEGAPGAFTEVITEAKPHVGSKRVAEWIRADLEGTRVQRPANARIQDRYSIRCAPQVLGASLDVATDARRYVEIELNSASDNPIIDPVTKTIAHGGNFYGGHICHAMDSVKVQLANVADLLDRQLLLLCNPMTSRKLPANLSGAEGPGASAHHGFKALQITTSALAAEAAKQSIPMSIFSRSTENHNQDKVSMGTIAARDALRILDLTENLALIHALALAQAADLRGPERFSASAERIRSEIRAISLKLVHDRPLDQDIAALLASYRKRELFSHL
jgi:histidine ammonia-lyase